MESAHLVLGIFQENIFGLKSQTFRTFRRSYIAIYILHGGHIGYRVRVLFCLRDLSKQDI